MTETEARIVLLEQALIESYNTISFLHGCLTDKQYSYAYPDQTLDRLKDIEKLVKIPEYCAHSGMVEGCDSCKESIELRKLQSEAQNVLDK